MSSQLNRLKGLIELIGLNKPIQVALRQLPQLTHLTKLTHLTHIVFPSLLGMLASGCLMKTATVTTRHFVLSPITTNEPAQDPREHLSVGIGFVKMPPYLLANSMAVRNGPNEIQYLEDALWAERLDHCFERTLAANVSRLLQTDSVYLADWGHNEVMVKLFVNVQQFDVDTKGRGTLVADWRIAAPNRELLLKSGCARLEQSGAAPHGNPEVIATTLSHLAAEFSRELAQATRAAPAWGTADE